MAKIIIKKSIEIYGEEYYVGNTIPYLYWIDAGGNKHELFYSHLDIIGDHLISVTPIWDLKKKTSDYCNIPIACIVENKEMYRFEYRAISGSYYISYQGIVYAKNPQEAMERLKENTLSRIWSKSRNEWQEDVSYVELSYNGMSCPVKNDIHLFPEPYNELNIKNPFFEHKCFLQDVADKISERTGIRNEFSGICCNSLTWDFDLGISYMTNCDGNGLYFSLIDEKGYEIWSIATTNVNKFIKETTDILEKELSNNIEQERE